jgi:enterochelin esterase-like enzyme
MQDYSACLARGGHLETSQVSSNLLKLPMEYRVYLPPCYDQQSERRYPVLYLIHGQNYNDDQWDRLGVDETLDGLVATGEIPPFIVVMPRDRSWAQPEVDMFGRVVMETLLPWIDKSYRTLPERRYRAIGGLSRGAGWAIHLGLSEWESFGAIGAHSLPVFWTDLPHLKEWLDTIREQSCRASTWIWVIMTARRSQNPPCGSKSCLRGEISPTNGTSIQATTRKPTGRHTSKSTCAGTLPAGKTGLKGRP